MSAVVCKSRSTGRARVPTGGGDEIAGVCGERGERTVDERWDDDDQETTCRHAHEGESEARLGAHAHEEEQYWVHDGWVWGDGGGEQGR